MGRRVNPRKVRCFGRLFTRILCYHRRRKHIVARHPGEDGRYPFRLHVACAFTSCVEKTCFWMRRKNKEAKLLESSWVIYALWGGRDETKFLRLRAEKERRASLRESVRNLVDPPF